MTGRNAEQYVPEVRRPDSELLYSSGCIEDFRVSQYIGSGYVIRDLKTNRSHRMILQILTDERIVDYEFDAESFKQVS